MYQAAVERSEAVCQAREAAFLWRRELTPELARELADQRAGPEIDAVIKAALPRTPSSRSSPWAKADLVGHARLDLDYCEP